MGNYLSNLKSCSSSGSSSGRKPLTTNERNESSQQTTAQLHNATGTQKPERSNSNRKSDSSPLVSTSTSCQTRVTTTQSSNRITNTSSSADALVNLVATEAAAAATAAAAANSKKSNSKGNKASKQDKKQKKFMNKFFKMSVILQPTAKQTASVIFLHGLGDTGHGWSSVFASFKRPNIKYIFPTAPIRPVTLNGGFEMNAWFDILGLRPDANQDEDGIKNSSQLLLNIVQEEIKNGIPAERIFIGGFSQGGATALYTALTSSIRFAGVIALSTWLPLHNRFPAQLKPCENLFTTPIFQGHGDSDPMVPMEWAQLSVKGLQAMGFTDVRFKSYRGLSHSSSEEELDDVSDFIKNIVPN